MLEKFTNTAENKRGDQASTPGSQGGDTVHSALLYLSSLKADTIDGSISIHLVLC